MNEYSLLGVHFHATSVKNTMEKLVRLCRSNGGSAVFTPNPVMLHRAYRSAELVELLNSADLLIPDGVGLRFACNLCGFPASERIAGIDAAYRLLRVAERKNYKVYFLGGKAGVAERAARRLKIKMPDLRVCGTHHGYFDTSKYSEENQKLLKDINRCSPDIVFVCMGFPAQEKWICENRASLPSVHLFMGLGGSLDVWSGKIRRAPRPLRKAGLEWLWRCILQPVRIKDVACLPIFLIEATIIN